MKHKHDSNTLKIRNWIAVQPKAKRKVLRGFLKDKISESHGMAHVLHGKDFVKLRKGIVSTFKIR